MYVCMYVCMYVLYSAGYFCGLTFLLTALAMVHVILNSVGHMLHHTSGQESSGPSRVKTLRKTLVPPELKLSGVKTELKLRAPELKLSGKLLSLQS